MYVYCLVSKIISKFKYIYNILNSFLFIINAALIYFLFLIKINEGRINLYIFIALFMGMYVFNKIFSKKLVKKK
ncbi:MAG: spore cortex biosynthesis protein YabQ, partial [Bacilli bacterium]